MTFITAQELRDQKAKAMLDWDEKIKAAEREARVVVNKDFAEFIKKYGYTSYDRFLLDFDFISGPLKLEIIKENKKFQELPKATRSEGSRTPGRIGKEGKARILALHMEGKAPEEIAAEIKRTTIVVKKIIAEAK